MTIRRIGAAVAILAILALVTPAQAAGLNAALRELGWGWSDGYHSRSHCPPRGKKCLLPAPSAFLPEAAPSAEPTPAAALGDSLPGRVVPPSRMARPTAPASSFR